MAQLEIIEYLCEKIDKVKRIPLLTTASPGFKIAYLFLFLLIGLFISTAISKIIFLIPGISADNQLTELYVNTITQSVFAIAIPSYLIVAWTNPRPFQYIKMTNSSKNIGVDTLFAVLVFIFSYTFTSFIGQLNKRFIFPKSLSGLEEVARSMENAAMETTNLLLSSDTFWFLILNILVVAGLAALSEEMFFRGAIQQFIQEKFKNIHLSVWLAAFVFSFIHFQFYGFLPRLFLGAILGYLYFYTRNLWVPIIFHFINNASVIVVYFFWSDTDWYKNIDEAPVTFSYIVLALTSLALTIALFVSYKKRVYNIETDVNKLKA